MEHVADNAQPELGNAPPEWVADLDPSNLDSAEDPLPSVTIPSELVIQPGSFTVSTLSVVMMLLLTAITVMALAASGLIAGLGMGLAMLSMIV